MTSITLHPVIPDRAADFKAARLRALQDTPLAYGSTYARESQFTEAEWAARIDNFNGQRGIGYLAYDADQPCGVVGCLLHDDDPTLATLVSMWVAPTHRRHGVGRLLVDAVLAWAGTRSIATVDLDVTSNNAAAFRFYESLGFTRNGKSYPYDNDSSLREIEMIKAI